MMATSHVPVPDAFDVEVERLTYGPDALAHYERCVVFVPFAAPGDRAQVQVEERRPGYVRARPTRLLEPGPTRVAPFCPAFGSCGGCQWQHVSPEAQREAKRAVVIEQLARLRANTNSAPWNSKWARIKSYANPAKPTLPVPLSNQSSASSALPICCNNPGRKRGNAVQKSPLE